MGAVHSILPLELPDHEGLVASCGSDGSVRLWDLPAAAQLGDPLIGHTGPVRSLVLVTGPHGPLLATAGTDHSIMLWDLRSRLEPGTLPEEAPQVTRNGEKWTARMHSTDAKKRKGPLRRLLSRLNIFNLIRRLARWLRGLGRDPGPNRGGMPKDKVDVLTYREVVRYFTEDRPADPRSPVALCCESGSAGHPPICSSS